MKDIQLWKIDGRESDPSVLALPKASQTETEEKLEEILVKVPNLLFEGLKLVGRQVETPSGPLDLLGVDEDGQLIVFELKRGTLTREAVAQVLDYTSFLAELSPSALSEFISKGSTKENGIDRIDDFDEWYEDQFAGSSIESIGKPRMVLVGLGVDDRTRRMVEFLASQNVSISLITFHAFNDRDGTYLAKQIEVLQKPTTQSTRVSKQTNLQVLERRMQEAKVDDFFRHVAAVLRTELKNSYEWPNPERLTYYLVDTTEAGSPTNHAYISLSIPSNPKGSLLLILQQRAIQAAGEEWLQIEQAWGQRVLWRKSTVEVRIGSQQDFQIVEPNLRRFCAAILRGRENAKEEEITAERQAREQTPS
jgi:hypothetical protein